MPPERAPRADVVVCLLAGGLSRRMGGGDKALRLLGGETLLGRVLRILRPQAACLIINANGDPARFAAYGLPVVADVVAGFAGPLAGVLSGMVWARTSAPTARWLVTVPTDSPFLPDDLVERLVGAAEATGAPLACAASGGQAYPVVGAWRLDLAEELRRALIEEGVRKIDQWTARHALVTVAWPTEPVDPFFNTNSPEDMAEAERLLARLGEAAVRP
jgi:molybdopterin-guanine dinucleotide biosynthesis protein A